jgi:hypothetical protein
METTSAPATENITVQGQAPATAKGSLWAGDHFSFHDLLDAINPLQHIPVVSTIYRAVTGDTLGEAARVVGDGLYGGVIGVISGLVDVAVIDHTGKDIGGNILAALGLDGDDKSGTSVADAPAQPSPTSSNPPIPVPAPKPAVPAAAPAPAQMAAAPAAAAPAQTGIPLTPQAQPKLMPLNNQPRLMPLNNLPHQGIPIDTSEEGILAIRTVSNSNPRPVALKIPPGTLSPNQRPPVTGEEFAQRMAEGLDKYKAMMTEREAASAGTTVNQVQ